MRTLFGRHRVALYRWLLRLVGDEALAEDLLSDVFLDVWRQAAAFEARSSVSTWLLAIARYKALSARRRRVDAELDDKDRRHRRRSRGQSGDRAAEEEPGGTAAPVAWPSLSPEHGEVIDLVYYHDKSVKEVAEIVGVGRSHGQDAHVLCAQRNWPRWSPRPSVPNSEVRIIMRRGRLRTSESKGH